jgi:hypothetical protein
MIAVAHVAGRLSDQARRPQRTHEQIVQQFDDSKVEFPPVQEPSGKTDADADSSNGYIRLRNTVSVSSASVSGTGAGLHGALSLFTPYEWNRRRSLVVCVEVDSLVRI